LDVPVLSHPDTVLCDHEGLVQFVRGGHREVQLRQKWDDVHGAAGVLVQWKKQPRNPEAIIGLSESVLQGNRIREAEENKAQM
jgi:hypothetical protein